ncbi:histidinol-phosphatase [Treponema parvum]|nr:histidinol-phosphatase [Treponema parvum]
MLNMITDYHTHSTFCDGKDSPASMAESAFRKGVSVFGFSSHGMYPFSSPWHIPSKDYAAYCNEIRRLKAEYEGRMDILLSFEADYISGICTPSMESYKLFKPDYLIGAVHFLQTQEGIFAVDGSAENVKAGIEKHFKGNGKAAVCEYFSLQREMLCKGDFTVWAHPDLVRKRNSVLNFFSEDESWYKDELYATAKEAKKAGVVAEINTGAISRGAMDDVYPSSQFLSILHDHGIPVTFSSDSHEKGTIAFAFDRAAKAAKKAGYTEVVYIDRDKNIKSMAF